MPSPFTPIMTGDVPGRLVHEDDACVALVAPAPVRPGHVIVVPRCEIDDWADLPDDLAAHLGAVARRIARALRTCFPCEKVAFVVIGLEVRHAHQHLVPVSTLAELDFARADRHADPAALDETAARVRAALGQP